MSDVAEYINEMKRLQENAVKVQQILSTIVDLDVSNLSSLFEKFGRNQIWFKDFQSVTGFYHWRKRHAKSYQS